MSDGMDLAKQVIALKTELEKKKGSRQELQGQLKSVMDQLTEYGVKTLQEAEDKIKTEESELEEMFEGIQMQMTVLKGMLSESEDPSV